MVRKGVASSVALALGVLFLLPIWAAAAYENDDTVGILFGFGYLFPIAVIAFVAALAWTILAYAMDPFHRGTPWTFVAALGMGGVLAGPAHAWLAGTTLDIYEDSYAGFWFAVATAAAIGIVLVVAAPARRAQDPNHGTSPGLKARRPSPPR